MQTLEACILNTAGITDPNEAQEARAKEAAAWAHRQPAPDFTSMTAHKLHLVELAMGRFERNTQ